MPYQTNYKSGAQKGLETKLEFWKQRDIKTEFNIAVSQSVNLAVERLGSKEYDNAALVSEAFRFFNILLETRNSKQFRDVFESYAKVETKPEVESNQGTVIEPY